MQDREKKRLLAELGELIEKWIDDAEVRGVAQGVQQERTRVAALLDLASPAEKHAPTRVRRRTASSARRASAASGYGSAITFVRQALSLTGNDPNGTDAKGIVECLTVVAPEARITEAQARAALKQLYNTGEAVRLARGHYRAREAAGSPLTHGEDPDASASGQLAFAAE